MRGEKRKRKRKRKGMDSCLMCTAAHPITEPGFPDILVWGGGGAVPVGPRPQ